jgi:dihydrofolate synthase/folylpolyglutamate synthase
MAYQDTIDYLYSRLPLFSRIGAAAIKNDLNNTNAICAFLGNPQNKFKTIHIAGTNGKGSTSHMLASIFKEAGYKTGLYTSPHFYDFRERIKVNGQMCSQAYVTYFTNRMKDLIEEIEPSFFEITVGMAFEYFAQEKCDIAIIETGLGGRLDSTNVIQPELSIITNIGWDHMALLGNSLSEIAGEKDDKIAFYVFT